MSSILAASEIAIVAIGRNEGQRLVRSLTSALSACATVVYVDSGSTDGSLETAAAMGARTAALDMSLPFTAARARNAGVTRLRDFGPLPEFVQFIDGDCVLDPGWLAQGIAQLHTDPRLGIVTGWRSEIHRDASIYNAMCDVEWHAPAGEIEACGGDMLVRSAILEKVGGFNETVIAAEDDEFCVRVRAAGWGIRRLPSPMTRHDADIHHFSQWWRRSVRAGHGYAQVGDLHTGYFHINRLRSWIFGVGLPALALVLLAVAPLLVVPVLGLYVLSWVRTARNLRPRTASAREAMLQALFMTMAKFANALGMLTYYWRRVRGSAMQLIEYK